MACKLFRLGDLAQVVLTDDLACTVVAEDDKYLKLRKVRGSAPADQVFDLNGIYLEATLETFDWKSRAVTELFGFDVDGDMNGGDIKFQVSTDNKVTWKWWDGAAWSVAGPSDFNSVTEVDLHISTLSLGTGLAFKIKLSPNAAGTATPHIRRIAVFCEYNWDFLTGVVESVVAFLQAGLVVSERIVVSLAAPTSTVTPDLKVPFNPATLKVYAVATDPFRRNPLPLASSNATSFTLVTPASGVLEARWSVPMDKRINVETDPHYEVAQYPSVVVSNIEFRELLETKTVVYYPEKSLNRTREQANSRFYKVSMRIEGWEKRNRAAFATSSAILKLLDDAKDIKDLYLDEDMPVLRLTPIKEYGSEPNQLFVKGVECDIVARDWPRDFNPVPLVLDVDFALYLSDSRARA